MADFSELKMVIPWFAKHEVWSFKSPRLAGVILEGKAAALSPFSPVEKT